MKKTSLAHNIEIHNKIAKKYESIHGEIYNDTEQSRLKEKLQKAISYVQSGSKSLITLDFGCGAGNLTTHLTDLGCQVIAADVSTGFLDLISSRSYKKKVSPFHLNGVDLKGLEDNSVDMVAVYSVLHHVPDYLSLMGEFSRVLKPGGILFIDHEMSTSFWTPGEYVTFQKEMNKKTSLSLKKYFIPANYINKIRRLCIDPKYQPEGDIHVFKDDHIEWDKIRSTLAEHNITIVEEEDYLLYRRNYDLHMYEAWKKRVGDVHLLIGKKAL